MSSSLRQLGLPLLGTALAVAVVIGTASRADPGATVIFSPGAHSFVTTTAVPSATVAAPASGARYAAVAAPDAPDSQSVWDAAVAEVPEPGMVLLFGLGLLAVARLRRRRAKPDSGR